MDSRAPIGFFDSGVGGLSVYSCFRKKLPCENTIYFGDLKNLPYGNKSQKELIGYARNILDFYKTKNVKAVVIACNTSSALAYDFIKDDYEFEIYPIIQSCAQKISEMDLNCIGVFATEGTVNSHAYKKELMKYNSQIRVFEIACPNWVSIVEGFYKDGEQDVKEHLKNMLNLTPQKIILGCTHYPYLMNILTKYADKSLFIDPSELFVEFIKDKISLNQSSIIGNEEFYVSSNPEQFVKNAELFYQIKSMPKVI